MTEEKIDMIPEIDPAPMFLESDYLPVIQESDSILLIPESDSASLVPESAPTQVISEGAESRNGHVRRYSTGNIGIPYKSVKILSRYLAASTGSCHDYCKYGEMRQDLETKTTTSPRLEKVMEKQGKGQYMGKTVTLAEGKKKLAVSFTYSLSSKIQKPDNPFVSKKEISSPTMKETVLLKQFSSPLNGLYPKPKPILSKSSTLPIKEHSSSKEDGESQENKEMGTCLVNSHGPSISREQTKLRRSKDKTSLLDEKNASSRGSVSLPALRSVKKVFRRSIVSSSPKRPEKRVSITNTGKFKRLKGVSRLKDHSGVGKFESEQPSSEDVSKKSLHSIESNAKNKTIILTPNSDCSPSSSSFHKHKSLKHSQKGISPVQISSPSAEKILRRTQYGNHVSQSPKSSENISLRRTKQGPHVIQSSISSLASSSTHGDTFSEHYKTDIENRTMNAKVESSITPKKGEVVSTKDNSSNARKLNFRAGRVIEVHPVINSPRRLKFRRRFLSDSQIDMVEITESSSKNAGIVTDDGGTNVANSECEKVVLKHQDVERKTAEQNLLNNMIEETAIELVKTRKSKVKALVGAFETVISLQDAKPLSTVGAC